MDFGVTAMGLVVGLVVGLTGMGGGALMTPLLVLFFNVQPLAAVSSDLVAAVVMKPVGGGVHLKRGTVNLTMVKWLALGSVPSAFVGVLLLRAMGNSDVIQSRLKAMLGVALLVAAASMVVKAVFDRGRAPASAPVVVRPLPTLAIGVAGGLIVGMTSVGSGSLMIVLLLFVYPMLGANQLVGTDLTQAVPLTLSAALGALVFGHVEFGVTTSLILGSVPAVLVGSLLSSTVPDRVVRPVIAFVIFASGLKYVGLSTTALGWTLCVVLLAAGILWLVFARPWRREPERAPV